MSMKTPPSPLELKQKMKKIFDEQYESKHSIEDCHMEMDELLCRTLESLGYGEAIAIFRGTPKWYA